MKNTVRINFEFPLEEYPNLKKVCAHKRQSLKDFATSILIQAIEEAEDEMLAQTAHERIESRTPEDLISWDEATRIAGWKSSKK